MKWALLTLASIALMLLIQMGINYLRANIALLPISLQNTSKVMICKEDTTLTMFKFFEYEVAVDDRRHWVTDWEKHGDLYIIYYEKDGELHWNPMTGLAQEIFYTNQTLHYDEDINRYAK